MKRIEKLVAERNELAAGVEYVRAHLDDDDVEQERFDEGVEYCRAGVDRIAELDRKIDELRAIEDAEVKGRSLETGRGLTVISREDNDPFEVRDITHMTPAHDLHARAMTAIERIEHLPDEAREAATQTLQNVKRSDAKAEVARRILYTGSDAYRSAFSKLGRGITMGLSPEENEALYRAQSLTGASGGFAIPFTLDNTIILTNAGAAVGVRALARTIQIVTDDWNGVSSAGATAAYAAEAAESGDDAITLVQPSITTHKADVFVPFSIEVGMDWPGFEDEMRMVIADSKQRLEATAFWDGTGSNQPFGAETIASTAGSLYTTATSEVLAIADIHGIYGAVPARSRQSASMGAVAEFSTLQEFRRLLGAAGDRSSFNEATASQPSSLFGWRIEEHSGADAFSAVDTGATATHYLAVVGDWSKYIIVERVGMNMELVPHLFATNNNRPSGQRGFYAWWRNGADSVDDSAFRVLVLVTSGA